MQQISRQIASLFLPAIQATVSWLNTIRQALTSLSGDQQRAIARWIEVGVAAAGVAMILPRVFAGLEMATAGVKALTAAFSF